MEKKVLITVNSHMDSADGESDSMSFVTEGKLIVENDEYIVSYDESEVTGLAGTTTTLKIGKDYVTLVRHGYVDTLLLFEVGKTHLSGYGTQYGNIMLGVTAKNLDINFNQTGGNISVDYILEYNRSFGGRNKLNVVVSEIKSIKEQEMEQ
ncbi:MAG: DUF1934 domain-containing protein [Clostridiaceae bacterium]|nr:DUF1934 domain-containing protein [Clostridiaceae bacterium]